MKTVRHKITLKAQKLNGENDKKVNRYGSIKWKKNKTIGAELENKLTLDNIETDGIATEPSQNNIGSN